MKLIATAVFAMFLGVVSVGVMGAPVSAAEKTMTTATAPEAYGYVAQEGDSYTLIARKAVQTYGKIFKVELTLGQVIFAETHLTQGAGSPMLTVGEKVSIKEATVKEWVQKAQKLTTSEKAAWQSYAQFVDFNTDKVGEARS